MKILIVKLSSIGDIVHCLPAAAAIRKAFPQAEITWIAEKRSADILTDSPVFDDLVTVDTKNSDSRIGRASTLKESVATIKELRGRRFDVALDFQGLIKSGFIARASGAKRVWGFSKDSLREKQSRFLLTDQAGIHSHQHVIYKNLSLAEGALDFKASRDELEFPIQTGESDTVFADRMHAMAGGDFVLLNPGGGWPTKLWSPKRFGMLSDMILERTGLPSVIVTGPGENHLASEIQSVAGNSRLLISSPSLKELFELSKRCAIYVGGDTGPTHIAVAAGAPIVGIFGPTEWWRNGSPRPGDICVERNDISCRINCHRRSCGNWICMEISPEKVADGIIARLAV